MSNIKRPTSNIAELLSASIDDQVTDGERRRLNAMIGDDPGTARELSELRYAVGLLADLPPVPVPRAFTLSQDMVQEAPSRLGWAWLNWLKPATMRLATAVVAVCLLVLSVGDATFQLQLQDTPQMAPLVQTEQGGLALEDGDPTAVVGKASTAETSAQRTDQETSGFLGLSPGLLLTLEVSLAVLLVLLVVSHWRLRHLI